MNRTFVIALLVTTSFAWNAHAQWSFNGVKIFYNAGNVGIGTSNPAHKLDVRSVGSRAVFGFATAASGTADGVYGLSSSTTGRGVIGYCDAATGFNYGVYGRADSSKGRGVFGYAAATSGVNMGVYGKTNSPNGYAGYFDGPRSYFSGNVGIATTMPTAKLHVTGAAAGQHSFNASDNLYVVSDDAFVGINRATRISGNEYFGVNAPVGEGSYGGMYVNTDDAGGWPFYGFATAGSFRAWTYFDGETSCWHLYNSARRLSVEAAGNVGIGVEDPAFPLHMASGAHCTAGGTWTNSSSRESKENFTTIDSKEILSRVVALPITRWKYKVEDDSVTHLGPMAQDFHAAFGLGAEEISITTVDADGVALAAIQGLHQIVKEKDQQIDGLQSANAAQQQQIDNLSSRLAKLEDLRGTSPTEPKD